MSQTQPEFATILKAGGYSVTRQRRHVFELLEGQEPLSMNELYARAKDQLDRASLYRIIAVFETVGIVRRVNIGWKYKIELSDMFAEHHHHLSCLRCHKVIPINEDELEGFISSVAATHHFTATEHQIEVQGYCQQCLPVAAV